jgi:hypothetical protein
VLKTPDEASTDHLLRRRSTVSTNLPTGLTGRLIQHTKTLDEVAVFDEHGTELASRPLAPDAPGPDAWTRALANLGYRRTTPWTPAQGGFRCGVEPLD